MILTFFLSFSLEGISYIHFMLKNNVEFSSPSSWHWTCVAVYFCQATLGLIVMLIFMTYNLMIMISVIIGLVIGYSYFGIWRLNLRSEKTETTYEVVNEKCCS